MAVKVKTISGKWSLTSMTQYVGARLPIPMVASLGEAAQSEGVTMTAFVKRAVERELERVMSGGEVEVTAVG